MSQPSAPQSPDRFTLPRDIPDAGYWDHSTRSAADARRRRAEALGDERTTNSVRPELVEGPSSAAPEDKAVLRQAQHERERVEANQAPSHPGPDDTRMLAHPAGRGWVPASRDLGIPSEHPSTPHHEHRTITIEHCFPDGSPDDPVAAVGCSQVFTRELRVRFLDHLAFKGNVRAAAALVGVSHETVYRKRRQDSAFAELWDAALVHARKYNESVLASRALDGAEVPVYYRGEIVGYRVVHDTRLLLAHLARLDRRVEDDESAAARAGRFDELLAGYAGHEPPAGFAEAAEEALAWHERGEAPALPPTREEYVTWRRSQAVGGKNAAKEAAAMEAAAAAAGAEWDAWHKASLARVGAIVESEVDDPWAEKPTNSPLPPAGSRTRSEGTAAGGGPEPTSEVPTPDRCDSDTLTPNPSRKREGDAGTAPTEPPYETKSYPPEPQNPVTSVNPPAPPAADGGRSRDTATPPGAGNLRPSKALCAARGGFGGGRSSARPAVAASRGKEGEQRCTR